jgi:rhamnosyltransferase
LPNAEQKRGEDISDVYAVIVSYYPDLEQLHTLLQALAPQVAHSIIVNNGPADNRIGLDSSHNSSLLESGSNRGVAAAINSGIIAAIRAGARYVLLLDQDSLPDENMVSLLLKAHVLLRKHGEYISAVGPSIVDRQTGRVVPFMCASPQIIGDRMTVYPVDRLLSSGSFIDVESYRQIGPMDEGLFIDLVDTEWFLRASAKGYQAFGVSAAHMYHQLGDSSIRYWWGRWRYLPRHSEFRSYYMFRNRILLLSRASLPVVQRLREFSMMFWLLAAGLILLPQRWTRLGMMVQGVIDGMHGRDGKGPFPH